MNDLNIVKKENSERNSNWSNIGAPSIDGPQEADSRPCNISIDS